MFGRHPRLAIDAFIGLEPDTTAKDKSSYVSGLQDRLKFAYALIALHEAKKQGKKHKQYFAWGMWNSSQVTVLVRNVGLKGKCKLADRWEKDIYVFASQPTPDIPIFEVKKEHSKEKSRILHRNLLLPFMEMPLCKNTISFYEQTSSNSPSDPGHTVHDSSSHPISTDSCIPYSPSCSSPDALSASPQDSIIYISVSQPYTISTSAHDKQVIPASAGDTKYVIPNM